MTQNSMGQVEEGDLSPEWHGFMEALGAGEVHAALVYLNARAPHRYTAIFKYDGDMVRNVHLVDKYDPQVRKGEDLPFCSAYCTIVGRTKEPLEIVDAGSDGSCYEIFSSPVVSYCGVLILNEQGEPYGTLCHYDMGRCEFGSGNIPLLKATARAITPHILEKQLNRS